MIILRVSEAQTAPDKGGVEGNSEFYFYFSMKHML